jgi:hypothetical protein
MIGKFRSRYRFIRGLSDIFVAKRRIATYSSKVLSIAPASLIAYWPLDEISGTNARNLQGVVARDGTFARDVATMTTGVGPAGGTAPLFDGTNDYCDIYSTDLNTAFNGGEGTLAGWIKVFGVGIWTDSTSRMLFQLRADASNRVFITRQTTDNQILSDFIGGGTADTEFHNGLNSTDWLHFAIAWSVTTNEVRHYLDGSLTETDTGVGTWAGDLSATETIIGASATTPTGMFNGYLADIAIWTTALSAAQILDLATV